MSTASRIFSAGLGGGAVDDGHAAGVELVQLLVGHPAAMDARPSAMDEGFVRFVAVACALLGGEIRILGAHLRRDLGNRWVGFLSHVADVPPATASCQARKSFF